MQSLEDSLDPAKWVKLDVSKKEGFLEYQVMRQHKKVDPTTMRYMVVTDPDEDPVGVEIQHTIKDKDPLKNIGTVELRVKEHTVLGIDLDGDCFELK